MLHKRLRIREKNLINRAILEINGENQKLELVRYIVGLNIIIFVGLIKGGVSEIK